MKMKCYGTADRISATLRMSASQSDLIARNISLSFLKKNETRSDNSSDLKCFCYALEGKHFM